MWRVLMLDIVLVLLAELLEIALLVDGKEPPGTVASDLDPGEFQARADGI